jgi:hypothetical protein
MEEDPEKVIGEPTFTAPSASNSKDLYEASIIQEPIDR